MMSMLITAVAVLFALQYLCRADACDQINGFNRLGNVLHGTISISKRSG